MGLEWRQRPHSQDRDQISDGVKGLYRIRYERLPKVHVLSLDRRELGRDKDRKKLITMANEHDSRA